ncbi:hypothetical protein CRM22_005754, partial [Opisthorchis felineus]
MRDLRTFLSLLVCIVAHRTGSTTILDNEIGNLKLYKDYWEGFYNKASEFMNSEKPKMALLVEILNDADKFDEITKDMVEFNDSSVRDATARIKTFPRTLLRDAQGLTETSVNSTVIWRKTVATLNNRRALNARLHDAIRELGRTFRNWRSINRL